MLDGTARGLYARTSLIYCLNVCVDVNDEDDGDDEERFRTMGTMENKQQQCLSSVQFKVRVKKMGCDPVSSRTLE